jgi:hypothetical protein
LPFVGYSKMKTIIACAAMLTAVYIPVAQARDVVGDGSSSCASWTERQRDGYFAVIDDAWVAGYLSSYNLYASAEISSPDSPARRAWMNVYCLRHPLDGIYKAVDEFVLELQRR